MESLEDIALEYKNSLELPADQPLRQIFLAPVGLIGSGKTTILKRLSDELSLVRLSSDELRKLLLENEFDFSQLKHLDQQVAYECAQEGYSVAFDLDCGSPETKEMIEALSEEFDALIFWIHVNTPEALILERLKKRTDSPLSNDPEVMVANYFEQKKKRTQESTKFDFFYTFDGSEDGLEAQVQECVEMVNNEIGQS